MCGLAGYITRPWSAADESRQIIAERMANAIRHRGPDSSGVWLEPVSGIALAHRRLAILELSPAGAQPMPSAGGRFVIAFNGEIYNHLELRKELDSEEAAPQWRGHSDTETLLAAFDYWGVERTLSRAVGMFSIALWDKREKCLYLARDRFGEKPLYYGWVGGDFVFGSELKALRTYPGFDNRVCPVALSRYLRLACVPAPYSIYDGLYKLEPGCLLVVSLPVPPGRPTAPLSAPASHGSLSLRRWYSLADAVAAGTRNPLPEGNESLDHLETTLNDAVRMQALADVPLGAFLSGGVDSSLIVALMQRQASRPVQTFTIGFEEAGFDESPHARAVAQHLGTEHSEFVVTARECREVIPDLPCMYDEPFADSSQIPTYLVCKAARRQVTVALTGDAGDEAFAGYNRYFWGPRVWRGAAAVPYWLRQLAAAAVGQVSPGRWDSWLGHGRLVRPGEKLHKLSQALRGAHSIDDLYLNLVSQWQDVEGIISADLAGRQQAADDLLPPLPPDGLPDASERMMYRDALGYLPDDILCKVDRAAMANSLETRAPFLDHRVSELAWRLPMGMKIRDGQGKWALRQVLYRHVPRELIERPKSGFAIPVGQWLRGPLRAWAEALLDEGRLQREGYLTPGPIRAAWAQHLSGAYDWTSRLWVILMFQAWLESVDGGAGDIS